MGSGGRLPRRWLRGRRRRRRRGWLARGRIRGRPTVAGRTWDGLDRHAQRRLQRSPRLGGCLGWPVTASGYAGPRHERGARRARRLVHRRLGRWAKRTPSWTLAMKAGGRSQRTGPRPSTDGGGHISARQVLEHSHAVGERLFHVRRYRIRGTDLLQSRCRSRSVLDQCHHAWREYIQQQVLQRFLGCCIGMRAYIGGVLCMVRVIQRGTRAMLRNERWRVMRHGRHSPWPSLRCRLALLPQAL